VKANSIVLDNGVEIKCGLVVWSAGIGPQPLISHLPFVKTAQAQLVCDPFLRLKGQKNVFAIGDCAAIEGYLLPATAQVAETQAIWLAKYLAEEAKQRGSQQTQGNLVPTSIKAYFFKNKGLLAYLGGYEALAQLSSVELGIGDAQRGGFRAWMPGAMMKGLLPWVLWRSAYLTKLGGWRLRMQVPIDWFKTFFLGRDISRF